jgi:hypothetical protein
VARWFADTQEHRVKIPDPIKRAFIDSADAECDHPAQKRRRFEQMCKAWRRSQRIPRGPLALPADQSRKRARAERQHEYDRTLAAKQAERVAVLNESN